jgi:hypothetical protein
LKPEETCRDQKSWYGRIKSGEIKVCPVTDCGGKLVHSDMWTWYECEKCEWNDEFQDLQDMGYQEPHEGWPRVTRTCAVCKATSDGSAMPMIELVKCPTHNTGHFLCRWYQDDQGHMVECVCSKGNVGLSEARKCPVPV